MANSSVVGQLRIILGLDTAAFMKGASEAQKTMRRLGRDLSKVGDNIADVGKRITIGITAPVAAAGVAIVKMAGDFESAMNEVAISTQASAAELKAMNDLALDLGKSTVFSASEAAGAMDMLAKAGMTAKDILAGGAKAALDLAAATGSQLDPAAAAITDTINNFKMTTADLPQIVNQVTGAVNQSKFDFDDFRFAMGSAGGVAGKVGVSFKDFTAVLAGTSSSFSSGQDAGTSFKTMLIALGNPSKKAQAVIEKFGLSFYDAAGKLKPMRDIAEQLQQKFANLSDEARTSAMADLFGSDAMRSGLALMTLGGKGLDDIAAGIAKVDASAQAAQRMKGFNAQLEQLKGSVETLAIKIGQSGILETVTKIVSAIGEFVDKLSETSPATMKFAATAALIAAAVGPVIVAVGTLVSSIGTIAAAIAPLLPVVEGGLVVALGSAAAAAAPFIAAGVAIYAMWDQIGPVLSQLGQRFMEAIGPRVVAAATEIGKVLSDLWAGPFGTLIKGVIAIVGTFAGAILSAMGNTTISLIAGFLEIVKGVFVYINDAIAIASKLLTGDFVGAWEATKTLIANVIKSLVSILEAVVPGITSWISKIYTAAKLWLQDKLGQVFAWVGEKVRQVGDFFYQLWDRVVGHSYVPDLVDGIAAEFKRLDAVMVDPTDKATKKTAEKFRDLAARVQGYMGEMFPSLAINKEYDAKIADMRKAIEKGFDKSVGNVMIADFERQRREALRSANPDLGSEADVKAKAGTVIGGITGALGGISGTMKDWGSEVGGYVVDGIGDAMDRAAAVRDRMRSAFKDTFGNGLRAALDGDFGSWFNQWWKDVLVANLEKAFDKILNRLADVFSGSSGGSGGGILSGIGKLVGSFAGLGGAASGLSSAGASLGSMAKSLPGFATGGTGLVRGRAGIDRNIVSFRATAGELVNVTKGNGGTDQPVRFIVEPSRWFDVRAAEAAQPGIQQMGIRAAAGGSQMAEAKASKRARRQLR